MSDVLPPSGEMPLQDSVRAFKPEELLGPLNELEKKAVPPALYTRGRAELLRRTPRVSIVGARAASKAGLGRAARLARFLVSERQAVIISGLARGIDTAAHLATIAAGGDTVAVLGTPLNRYYPPENRALQDQIGRDHLLVSLIPLKGKAVPHSFPMRNRIMALISDASVIVAANEGSGTRHQGWEALRLGRPVFVMKSLADAGPSWVREMLSYGAEILSEPEELLDFLPQPAADWRALAGVAF